ncbi:MAG: hypothetical protein L3K14_04210 [Thermoplasmata archaeon]|nr:hypothetical protein [Thermoplasmata archaeon]
MLYESGGPPCAYCGMDDPEWILTVACPINLSGPQAAEVRPGRFDKPN